MVNAVRVQWMGNDQGTKVQGGGGDTVNKRGGGGEDKLNINRRSPVFAGSSVSDAHLHQSTTDRLLGPA